jgi:hypothetical protein
LVCFFKREATPQAAANFNQETPELARLRSGGNLWQLAVAMHNYATDHNVRFPPAAIRGQGDKPLLSWRVALLPYLGHEKLYKEFKLDEPWDSPHNRPLLAKMPKVYAPPGGKTKEPHTTCYQVLVGEDTIFSDKEGMAIARIPDGTSNTLLIVEAREAVPWTKPADLPFAADKPLPEFGGLLDDGLFSVVFADGSVRVIRRGMEEEFVRTLRALITYSGGEVFIGPRDFFWER